MLIDMDDAVREYFLEEEQYYTMYCSFFLKNGLPFTIVNSIMDLGMK